RVVEGRRDRLLTPAARRAHARQRDGVGTGGPEPRVIPGREEGVTVRGGRRVDLVEGGPLREDVEPGRVEGVLVVGRHAEDVLPWRERREEGIPDGEAREERAPVDGVVVEGDAVIGPVNGAVPDV